MDGNCRLSQKPGLQWDGSREGELQEGAPGGNTQIAGQIHLQQADYPNPPRYSPSPLPHSDAVYSSPVGSEISEDAAVPSNNSSTIDEQLRPLGEMHPDRPSTATQPLYFRVVDLAQLSHTGLEHCKFGHQSYAQLNATRLALGLPMLKVPPKG